MRWIRIAGVVGALAVVAGAFGAHWLASHLDERLLEAYRAGVQYHLVHAVVLLALGLWSHATGRSVATAATLILAGVVLFSGSLYLLCLSGVRAVGMITPLGGLLMIAGWIEIARSVGSTLSAPHQ